MWNFERGNKKGLLLHEATLLAGRDEATRTPDPYVPNVVRYQLRYIPLPSQESAPLGAFLF